MSNSKHIIENQKKHIPGKLKKRNLNVNIEKTEQYSIRRNGDDTWRKCKYLGSLLDTTEDISRRKGLAIQASNKLKHILESNRLGMDIKIRVLNAYVASIFLYNSETWTITKSQEEGIDVFQRKFLRMILNIKWPKKISNEELYEKTKQKRWSKEIKRRRLTWLGHLLRLPEDTPARQALCEALRKSKKPRGKPRLTWLGLISKDLNINIHEHIQHVQELANDRRVWFGVVRCAMSNQ